MALLTDPSALVQRLRDAGLYDLASEVAIEALAQPRGADGRFTGTEEADPPQTPQQRGFYTADEVAALAPREVAEMVRDQPDLYLATLQNIDDQAQAKSVTSTAGAAIRNRRSLGLGA